jgi:hypothetical protein
MGNGGMLEEGWGSVMVELASSVEDHFRITVHIPYAGICFLGISGIFYCVLPTSLEAGQN